MSTQHALTKFVGPIKVAGVEGSGCLGHHRAPVRIHGSGGRSRRHGCLEQPPFTGCLHDPQGSVSGGGGMKGPTELQFVFRLVASEAAYLENRSGMPNQPSGV